MDSSLPSGLTNLGNTCFANTTLQAILRIPLLQEYINKHKEYSKNCYCQYQNDINVLLARLCCICLIKRLQILCIHECTKVIQPTEIYNQLNSNGQNYNEANYIFYRINSTLVSKWSKDAHEFVTKFFKSKRGIYSLY